MSCNLYILGYGLGIILLGILVIIGLQIIVLLYKLNTILKRVNSLTDIQNWLYFFKTFFSKKKC